MGVVTDLYRANTFVKLDKYIRELGVSLDPEKFDATFQKLQEESPQEAKKLKDVLTSLGLFNKSGTHLSKVQLDKYYTATRHYAFREKLVYGKWFEGVAKFATGVTNLIVGWRSAEKVKEIWEISKQGMSVALEGQGNLEYSAGQRADDFGAYIKLNTVLSAAAAKYGFGESEVAGLQEEFAKLFGPDTKAAKRTFEAVMAFARTANKDVHEVWRIVEERAKTLGVGAEESANQLLDDMVIDATNANENIEEGTEQLKSTAKRGAIWRKDYLRLVESIQEEGGKELVPNAWLLSQMAEISFQESRKIALTYRQMEKTAGQFLRMLNAPPPVKSIIGQRVMKLMAEEIASRTKDATAQEKERVTEEVMQKYVGETQVARAKAVYENWRNGDNVYAAQHMGDMVKGTKEGMALTVRATSGYMNLTGAGAIAAMGVESGMNNMEAVTWALAVRSGKAEAVANRFAGGHHGALAADEEERRKEALRKMATEAPLGIVGRIFGPAIDIVKNPLVQLGTATTFLLSQLVINKLQLASINYGWLNVADNYKRAAGQNVPARAGGVLNKLRALFGLKEKPTGPPSKLGGMVGKAGKMAGVAALVMGGAYVVGKLASSARHSESEGHDEHKAEPHHGEAHDAHPPKRWDEEVLPTNEHEKNKKAAGKVFDYLEDEANKHNKAHGSPGFLKTELQHSMLGAAGQSPEARRLAGYISTHPDADAHDIAAAFDPNVSKPKSNAFAPPPPLNVDLSQAVAGRITQIDSDIAHNDALAEAVSGMGGTITIDPRSGKKVVTARIPGFAGNMNG